MRLNKNDLELINEVYKKRYLTEKDILFFNREQIIELTYLLAGLIGYDEEKNDIDTVGKMADDTISKLLILLEEKQKY